MMGTSLMTMPWAFGQAGYVGGIFIMLFMAGIALYTATRLLTLQKTMGKATQPFLISFNLPY